MPRLAYEIDDHGLYAARSHLVDHMDDVALLDRHGLTEPDWAMAGRADAIEAKEVSQPSRSARDGALFINS